MEHALPRSALTTSKLQDHGAGAFVLLPPTSDRLAHAPALRVEHDGFAGAVLLGRCPWEGRYRPGWMIPGGYVASYMLTICSGAPVSATLEALDIGEPDNAHPWEMAMGQLAMGPFGTRLVGCRPDGRVDIYPIDPATWTVDATCAGTRPTAVSRSWRLSLRLAEHQVQLDVHGALEELARHGVPGSAGGGL